MRNRIVFLKQNGIDPKNCFFPRPGLSDRVLVAKSGEAELCKGNGLCMISNIQVDAVITDDPDLVPVFLVADCLIVALFDPRRGIRALVHAGRAGTFLNISGKAVRIMKKIFGTNPGHLLAEFSECICPVCFNHSWLAYAEDDPEIGKIASCIIETECGFHLDLPGANRLQLLDAGIFSENINYEKGCTCCSSAGDRKKSFSHYRWAHSEPGQETPGRNIVLAKF